MTWVHKAIDLMNTVCSTSAPYLYLHRDLHPELFIFVQLWFPSEITEYSGKFIVGNNTNLLVYKSACFKIRGLLRKSLKN